MRRAGPILFRLLLVSLLPVVVACGKKGPPLAPLRPAPGTIGDLAATRLGETVQLQFTVPTTNADGSSPADLARIDVFALTGKAEGPLGRPLTPREIETLLTRVASVEIQPPPPPEEEGEEGEAPDVVAPVPGQPPDARPTQGAVVRVEETLTEAIRAATFVHPDAERVAKIRAAAGDEQDEPDVPSTEGSGRTLLWPQPPVAPERQYFAIAYSSRDRAGAPAGPLGVPLVPAPAAPPGPTVTHDATAFTVSWTLPPGARAPIQPTVTVEAYKEAVNANPDEAVLPARPLVTYGPAHTYRVYQLPAADVPPPPGTGPLNPTPLESTTFVDPRMEFGVSRCYAVRSVERRGGVTIESPLSPSTCVTATDTYPPPAPTGLVAVGSGGGVSLIWEPVTAPDLAGYLVLRGVEGEALRPITANPVAETTYRDTTTEPGVMYIYAVVAVDKATPANASPESNRVRESAR